MTDRRWTGPDGLPFRGAHGGQSTVAAYVQQPTGPISAWCWRWLHYGTLTPIGLSTIYIVPDSGAEQAANDLVPIYWRERDRFRRWWIYINDEMRWSYRSPF